MIMHNTHKLKDGYNLYHSRESMKMTNIQANNMMENPLKRSLCMELNLLKEGFTILHGCALKKLPLYSITIDSLGT